MVLGLRCLQQINVSYCDSLEEIVAKEDGDVVSHEIEFCQLRKLSLSGLPKLINFFSNEEIIRDDQQENKSSMPFFEKVLLPKLEELSLNGIPHLTTEIFGHEISFSNLTTLSVFNCEKLEYLLTPSIAMSITVHLQSLTIRYCARMKHIIAKEGGEANTETLVFPQLRYLWLHGLPNLTSFYSEVEEIDPNDGATRSLFNEKVQFPSLKALTIESLGSIKTIWPNMSPRQNLSFLNLQGLTVRDCKGMKYVFPADVAPSLMSQLENLTIYNCGEVETIVGVGDDEELQEIEASKEATIFTFPKLLTFELAGLPKLKWFYPREHTTEWPALLYLEVYYCGQIKILTSDLQQAQMFPLFSIEKVVFSSITGFKNLGEMKIVECHGLEYLFTPSIATGLQKLQKIRIRNCSMMKAIVIGCEGEAKFDGISFAQLSSLSLKNLPKLTTFYAGVEEKVTDSNEKIDSVVQSLFSEKTKFPDLKILEIKELDSIYSIWQECAVNMSLPPEILNLQEVVVGRCKSLNHVFPTSVARSLIHLEKLSVEDCAQVEKVIDTESSSSSEATKQAFNFPKLREFTLKRLSKLKCFYPKECTIEWSKLEKLDVHDCPNICALDLLTFHEEEEGDSQVEKIISNLEYLRMRKKDLMKFLRQDGHLSLHILSNVKNLIITEIDDEAVAFLSKLLHTGHNHETLEVNNSSFQEIFPNEGEGTDGYVGDDAIHLPHLRRLILHNLSELRYICKQDRNSLFVSILDKLHYLAVKECHGLRNLVLPSVSFRLLTGLYIYKCDGLVNLIQPSTATSLRQLRRLTISGCKMIEEIIACDHESSVVNEIIFNELMRLVLEDLPRLTNFCSYDDYSFNFPLLDDVSVIECPNMETFSSGITTTPKLHTVYFKHYKQDGHWEGEINRTIRQRFEEMAIKMALPSTSLSNQIQEHENLAEELIETKLEGQICENDATNSKKEPEICEDGKEVDNSCVKATRLDNVVDICAKGKGKELEVSEEIMEHSRKFQEIPRHPDPLTHNYTTQGEIAAGFLASQHDVGSSSQPSHHSKEIQRLSDATWTTSSNNQSVESSLEELQRLNTTLPSTSFKAGGEIQDKSAEKLTSDPIKEDRICENVLDVVNEAEICDQEVDGRGKERKASEEAPRLPVPSSHSYTDQEHTVGGSLASQFIADSSSALSPSTSCPPDEFRTNPLAARVPVGRQTLRIPSTSLSSHFEGSEICEEGKESDNSCVEATKPGNVANICGKGIGKDLEVTEEVVEHSRKLQEISCHSDPSAPNYTVQEPSFAESSQFSKHSRFQDSQGLATTLTSTSSSTQIGPEAFTEPAKEGQICMHVIDNDKLHNKAKISEEATNYPTKERMVAGSIASQHVLTSPSQLSPPTSNPLEEISPSLAKELCREIQRLPDTVLAASSTHHSEIHDKSAKKLTAEPLKEHQICENANEELVNETEICDQEEFKIGKEIEEPKTEGKTWTHLEMSPCLVTEAGTGSTIASNSQEMDLQRLLSEYIQNLQARPLRSFSAQQLQFIEDAGEWFCGYAKHARECVEQNKEISELELEIAEMEAQLEARKAKKKVMEEKYEASVSRVPRFG